jgi:hypothetical protein
MSTRRQFPMKLGFKTLLAGVLVAALFVPTAGAKPGNGNGPPAWAGSGGGGAKVNGKPAWAGQGQANKAEKAEQRLARRGAREAAQGDDQDGPKHQNPAWVCKFEREEMDDEAFADEYGTNENKANAFGKCVSKEAHDRDRVATDDEPTAPEPESSEDVEGSDEGDPAVADVVAFVRAFVQSMRELL